MWRDDTLSGVLKPPMGSFLPQACVSRSGTSAAKNRGFGQHRPPLGDTNLRLPAAREVMQHSAAECSNMPRRSAQNLPLVIFTRQRCGNPVRL